MKHLSEFYRYVLSFYGPDGIYPMNATLSQVRVATKELRARNAKLVYDSVDREFVRDILIERFGLVFPQSPRKAACQ